MANISDYTNARYFFIGNGFDTLVRISDNHLINGHMWFINNLSDHGNMFYRVANPQVYEDDFQKAHRDILNAIPSKNTSIYYGCRISYDVAPNKSNGKVIPFHRKSKGYTNSFVSTQPRELVQLIEHWYVNSTEKQREKCRI